jgi:hypothetical protein
LKKVAKRDLDDPIAKSTQLIDSVKEDLVITGGQIIDTSKLADLVIDAKATKLMGSLLKLIASPPASATPETIRDFCIRETKAFTKLVFFKQKDWTAYAPNALVDKVKEIIEQPVAKKPRKR